MNVPGVIITLAGAIINDAENAKLQTSLLNLGVVPEQVLFSLSGQQK